MANHTAGVHEASERFVDEYATLDPIAATYAGLTGYESEMTDFSPDGDRQRAELYARYLRRIEALEPADDSETAAKAHFLERVGIELELHEAGLTTGHLNVIASTVQNVRAIFDLLPTDTAEQWADIRTLLGKVPGAVDGIKAGLRDAAGRGQLVALRQVTKVAEQCDTWSGADGESFFGAFVKAAPDAQSAELESAANSAAEAYGDLARFLRAEIAGKAPAKDAVGEDVYKLWSRYFLGAQLDLREAYEWGWTEFFRVEKEMVAVAERIKAGGSLADAAAALDADPRYRVRGRREFEQWMQQLSDNALAELRGVHFDIPDALMRLDCKIAPDGGGVGAYYTGPSDDFSRAGAMWWSVPAGREDFSTWREVSTVYHEGVPGHHLQIATGVHEAESLNRYQRLHGWVSGHGEGWALYAERLMQELGYLTDDGDLMGMLDAHLFRAARVIIDIGMHLELEIPAGSGFHDGERWTPELGLEFMLTRTITDAEHVHDEIDRYLGWPGQAPSYKLGERYWLQLRDEARRRDGEAFDIKDFHMRALRLGSMGLDNLGASLRG
ncbi:DUF885 domain-containing protein [Kibdelosporangium phytohabitans]|uniref:DUF885 domain-containing protein n=1 Tax=Kibdelosporangium phytohabitans TaxID=860235 RepID=A0A0N9I0Y1_9PSEU|nr:DUF885 domain-containing protein [Kibdelosporangium phytohabitans]ALG07842.1 hypothetical protein AOZ06_13795 [Kibdelosporangium phytohabitans]MBE1471233.1 uncharacterized protein (DUF885 family) [Kibdelosporangium phytohabitans]